MDGELRGATVVIVEDDGGLRSVVQRALQAEGCHTHAVGVPSEALALLVHTPTDLFLVDLGLPEMDGLALIQRAREIQPSLPVVVMTGWETAQSAIAAADLGVDGYLSKPFTLKRLTDAGRRAVGRQQLERRLRALEAEQAANAARLDALHVIGRSLPHEIHQPLSCVVGYAALLAEGGVNADEVRDYAAEIVSAAERLTEIVRKLEIAQIYAIKEYGRGNVLLDLAKTSGTDPS
ncbi:MAG TPA: response regulator [Chloroflexota bacterium]|nr:response regulator [Chloroflexota bacterium]